MFGRRVLTLRDCRLKPSRQGPSLFKKVFFLCLLERVFFKVFLLSFN